MARATRSSRRSRGDQQGAAAAVPQSFLEEAMLVGPRSFVKERLAEYPDFSVAG